MKKLGWWVAAGTFGIMVTVLAIGFAVQQAFAADRTAAGGVEVSGGEAAPAATFVVHEHTDTIALAMAIVTGVACLGAGYAVAQVGSAALGAASENPEMLGRSLIFVGLAEGIAIYGLIIAILLLRYLAY